MGLSLNRKLGQQIRIGDDIVVRLIQVVSRKEVRLYIDAPLKVSVDREEVYQEKLRKSREASK